MSLFHYLQIEENLTFHITFIHIIYRLSVIFDNYTKKGK